MRGLLPAILVGGALASVPAAAADLMRGRTELPELVLGDENGNDYALPVKDIEMEGGKAYRLKVTAKGGKEYKFVAPDFFRHIWINQIVINRLEVHMAGAPHALEFDDQGTIAVDFVAIRPGQYGWAIQGLEERGMTGKLVVK
jgi:hypothetical protein